MMPILYLLCIAKRWLIVSALLLALVVLGGTQRVPVALAAGMTVTTTDDTTTTDGACSLREAIGNANNNAGTYPDCAAGSGSDTITFNIPAADPGCSVPNTCTITLTAAFGISDTLTVDGSAQKITLDGVTAFPVFVTIVPAISLSINDLTLYRGNGGLSGGGGVANNGANVFANRITFREDIGINGAALDNRGGTATIVNSTIFAGTSFSQVANGAVGDGGTLNVYNTTIVGGGPASPQYGVAVNSGTVFLQNTIITNHTGSDCLMTGTGALTANFFNFDTDGSCDAATTSATLNLGALQDNGGPTPTIALLSGSSAIGTASNAICNAFPVNARDQRGVTRPVGTFCDAGAFEVEAPQAGPNFVVTQTADTDDGVCGVLFCTLREAINTANGVAGANTITFAIPPTEACAPANVCTITLDNTLPTINTDVTIDGSAQTITVDGADLVNILVIDGTVTAALNDLTLTRGLCDGCDGGALLNNNGALTMVTRLVFLDNSAAEGGAIENDSSDLTVVDSTFDGNDAVDEDGGGIRNDDGAVTIVGSTFTRNTSVDDGGALDNRGGGVMYVVNSTITGNTASDLGGGFRNVTGSTGYLSNVTITANEAGGGGGGIAEEDESVEVKNSIVAGNTVNSSLTDPTADCLNDNAGLVSGGYNLVGAKTGCPLTTGDQTTDPTTVFSVVLDPLGNNGGPTQTQALVTNSPAINGGRPTGCTDPNDVLLTADQRGEPRPFDVICDIGAYELQASTALDVTGFKGVRQTGMIVVKWRTTTESQIAGFHIYRREGKDEWTKANVNMKQAKHAGTVAGAKYRFKDKDISSGASYRYKIEVVYLDAHREWTDVIKVK